MQGKKGDRSWDGREKDNCSLRWRHPELRRSARRRRYIGRVFVGILTLWMMLWVRDGLQCVRVVEHEVNLRLGIQKERETSTDLQACIYVLHTEVLERGRGLRWPICSSTKLFKMGLYRSDDWKPGQASCSHAIPAFIETCQQTSQPTGSPREPGLEFPRHRKVPSCSYACFGNLSALWHARPGWKRPGTLAIYASYASQTCQTRSTEPKYAHCKE